MQKLIKCYWLINFNGMSICLQLSHASKLGNHIHRMFIFTFFVELFLKSFFFVSYGPIKYDSFLNRSIWPIDGTLTGITTPGQSGLGVTKLSISHFKKCRHHAYLLQIIWNKVKQKLFIFF